MTESPEKTPEASKALAPVGNKLPVKAARPGLPARRGSADAAGKNRSSFETYIQEINRIPLLTREQEQELATLFQESRDPQALKKLVEANLRFVVKIAYSYKHYNVKLIDLIQEGNIGLIRAVEKFNVERGYRLISYAVWWIKAYMQNYIIRSWSMVRVGTTQMQRQLFFRYQTDKEPTEAQVVGETLQEDVPEGEENAVLIPAEARKQRVDKELVLASRDFSLDALIDGTSNLTYMDVLPDGNPHQEENMAKAQVMKAVGERVAEFMDGLSDKERYIFEHRLFTDEPETLQVIGEQYGVSRERIRQIETQLKDRLRVELQGIDGIREMVE